MPKARIYVNRHVVRKNIKNKTDEATIAIKTYQGVEYCKEAEFLLEDGQRGYIKQNFHNPICSGARVWLELPRDKIVIIVPGEKPTKQDQY